MRGTTNVSSMAFWPAVMTVVIITLVMVLVTLTGVLDTATVELGLDHYAEKRMSFVPEWIPMPLNTIINCGYPVCGLSWILFIRKMYHAGAVNADNAYLFFVFNVMGCFYGFVQLYRIIFQTRFSAILDQWYTLPFFMLVYCWAQHIMARGSWQTLYICMSASVMSYSLTLLTAIGFEISLGIHIVLAVIGGSVLYKQHPVDTMLRYFILAVISCCGFVVLKLLDHHLPYLHWVFSYVSGHFLSKICDVLQFHYVSKFFSAAIFRDGAYQGLKKE